jgi:ABC-2 type transport system ATP-binding protein
MSVVRLHGVTRHYGQVAALDGVSLTLTENAIHGLLGRNGAGKTTLMRILIGQEFETAGTVAVFGEHPYENAGVLSRVCFVRESQRYPERFRVRHALRAAELLYPNWDKGFADTLTAGFALPPDRLISKLSRGQLSALGVIIGLASRAPLTLFDEPYLGLDAVARQIFYDRLLEDYSEHPRTVVLSTHLIDEVSNLLEHVIVIDDGRIVIDRDADELRGTAATVVGSRSAVEAFTAHREVLHREGIGGLASVTIADISDDDRRAATTAGLELAPVSLQQLVIRTATQQEDAR